LNRYSGKDRPGKVQSPYGPLATRWAYPPGIAESGVGLLETLSGLAVFIILAMVGAQAIRGAVDNRREAAQIRHLADAVPAARQLSAISRNGSERNKSERYGTVKEFRGGRE
jgi:hypothetical protein